MASDGIFVNTARPMKIPEFNTNKMLFFFALYPTGLVQEFANSIEKNTNVREIGSRKYSSEHPAKGDYSKNNPQ